MTETIDTLLAKRQTRRIGQHGNPQRAKKRLGHSQFLAEHYAAYDPLRRHLFHSLDHPDLTDHEARIGRQVIDHLHTLGWIVQAGRNTWQIADDHDIHAYLAGGWLEELAYCAHELAGFDEAYFGQDVEWTVKGITGTNEIDVLARRGNLLSFTSCKTLQAEPSPGKLTTMRNFLIETDYWNIHFADDQGRAMLMLTADLYDEMRRNKHRYPTLLARSTILEVSLLGLEDLRWDKLVEGIRTHWKGLESTHLLQKAGSK